MDRERLQRLGDKQAIRDVLMRYWRGIDRADEQLVRAAYHPDAYDDHGYYEGDVDGFVRSLHASVFPRFTCTMHYSGHIAIDFTGANTAYAESYTEAHHVLAQDGSATDGVYGLRYVDCFERRDGDWRIAHRVCTWDWRRSDRIGDQTLAPGFFRGVRNHADPIYQHPVRARITPNADELLAKQECYDVLMRYVRGIDRCDTELVRSAYHPDAYDNHGAYQGDLDGFIAWVKPAVMDSLDVTMHKVGNVLIEVAGDNAFGEAYAETHHILGEDERATDRVMPLRYIDRFERRHGAWRIAHRIVAYEWQRTDAIGSQRFAEGYRAGHRDGSDLVLRSRQSV
jgi:hypothetical protein